MDVFADSRLHILWEGTTDLQLSDLDEIEISWGFKIRQPSTYDVRASLIRNLTRGGEYLHQRTMFVELDPPLRGYVEDIRTSENRTEFYLIEKGSTGEPEQRGRVWEYLGMTERAFWLDVISKDGICSKPGCGRTNSYSKALCRYHLAAYTRWVRKIGEEW